MVFNFRRKIWETRKSPATHDNRRTEGGELLIYVLVEIFSFGTLSKFYKNMKNIDKKEVAKEFGVGYTYFESWLESISYVRKIWPIMEDCIMQNYPNPRGYIINIEKRLLEIIEFEKYKFKLL